MIYFKAIFTNELELAQIGLSLSELQDIIDVVILIEPSFRHNGEFKPLIGANSIYTDFPNLSIEYIIVPRLSFIKVTRNSKLHHKYETITRGYFVKALDLKDDDIIISVDADEILYRNVVVDILERLKNKSKYSRGYVLKLHQFFYNYSWRAENHNFVAPTISYYGSRYREKKYWFGFAGLVDWRYSGQLFAEYGGVHLSWFNSIDELVVKVKTWSHSGEFNFTEEQIREMILDDIRIGRYSFRSEPLNLVKANPEEYLPTSINI